jgi:hypothetical protein
MAVFSFFVTATDDHPLRWNVGTTISDIISGSSVKRSVSKKIQTGFVQDRVKIPLIKSLDFLLNQVIEMNVIQ